MRDKITIVGGGPAGLFCAFQLLERGFAVDLYDQMKRVGSKFIVAGNGGLNLTHSEPHDSFASRYGKDSELFSSLLQEFSPENLRTWLDELGVQTFVGSSGRIFPSELKAHEIVSLWTDKLKSYSNFNLFLEHKLIDISSDRTLTFQGLDDTIKVQAHKVIFALGGASWEKTGSDGKWKSIFQKLGVEVQPFLPMNCGFEREWSEFFISKVDRTPVKNVVISARDREVRGEIMLTPFGIEGGAIYAISNVIRDEIIENGKSIITIDLKPDLKKEDVLKKLKSKKKKDSLSNHLRKSLRLDREVVVLLRELTDSKRFDDSEYLARQIKGLEVELLATRPISEAISTSGGVAFSGLTDDFEIEKIPGIYIAGEMLDFEAPTGGYMLQGCFSTAWRVINSISK